MILNNEQLLKLNDKLDKIVKNDSGKNELFKFFDLNHSRIYNLFCIAFYNVFYRNLELVNDSKKVFEHVDDINIEKEEFNSLVLEFFSRLGSDYYEKASKDLMNDNLIFVNSTVENCYDSSNDKIFIKNSKTLYDCRTFVHEYIHKLTHCDGEKNLVFGELAPILTEFKFLDFLSEKGYDSATIKKICFKRLENTYSQMSGFIFLYPLYRIKIINGNVTNDDIEKLISRSTILYSNRGATFQNLNNIINSDSAVFAWRHSFATMIASTIHQNYDDYKILGKIIETFKTLEFNDFINQPIMRFSDSEIINSLNRELKHSLISNSKIL